jgi:hypothetical protein
VSVGAFLIVLTAGAGVVALWVDARFPKIGPKDMRQVLLHVGLSIVIAQLAVPLLIKTIAAAGSPAGILFALFAIGCPALTYCLLASIWIIKGLQAAFRHH